MSGAWRRAVVVVAVVVVSIGGCARAEFKDRTAVVEVGGSHQDYVVDSCGRDDRTIYVVGRAQDGAIFQAVMGLKADHKTAVATSTGLTIDADPSSDQTRLAAFGAESWARRGSSGKPPGRIDSARLHGSRVQFDGEVVPLDATDAPVPGADPTHFSFDARCDRTG